MRITGYGIAAAADQKVQVGALVCLQHMAVVQAHVAGSRLGRGHPGQAAAGQFFVADMQMQATARHVQFDLVAVLHQGQRAARGGFGCTCSTTVPKAVPLMRASEMRTMSVTPSFSSLGGRPILPTSAMPG